MALEGAVLMDAVARWLGENWQWVAAALMIAVASLLFRTRAAVRRYEVARVRALWAQLPPERQREILYVRERIHRSEVGPMHGAHTPDEDLARDFEGALSNALREPWSFALLREQVEEHAAREREQRALAGMRARERGA